VVGQLINWAIFRPQTTSGPPRISHCAAPDVAVAPDLRFVHEGVGGFRQELTRWRGESLPEPFPRTLAKKTGPIAGCANVAVSIRLRSSRGTILCERTLTHRKMHDDSDTQPPPFCPPVPLA